LEDVDKIENKRQEQIPPNLTPKIDKEKRNIKVVDFFNILEDQKVEVAASDCAVYHLGLSMPFSSPN